MDRHTGRKKISGYSHTFSFAPAVLLEKGNADCIKEIIIKVKSKQKAAEFLTQQHLIKDENGKLLIDPEKLNGLRVLIEE